MWQVWCFCTKKDGHPPPLCEPIFWRKMILKLAELQKRADRANQLVLFFWPVLIFGKSTRKTGENTRKQAKTRKNRRKTGAFLVLIFWGGKLVCANFYAFCNYARQAFDYSSNLD